MKLRMSLPSLVLALTAGLVGGCSWSGSSVLSGKVDYNAARTRSTPLEVPPDLSTLPRDERFTVPERPQTVTASSTAVARPVAQPGAPAASAAASSIVPSGAIAHIERQGSQRWLAVSMPPEKAWPILLEFWPSVGLAVEKSDQATGVMETVWAENRAKLPQDIIRQTLGRVLGSVYSTGEQDKYRARLERTPDGTSEIFISHRGMVEVFTSSAQDRTAWQPRPNDPEMEAEMLQRLLVRFDSTAAKSAATVAASVAPGAPGSAGAPIAAGTAAATLPPETAHIVKGADGRSERLDLDDPFDRAWRRIGLALDRGGFTVEDRDRVKGTYFVRYLDPDFEAKEKDRQGFFTKFLGRDKPVQAPQYRVVLASAGDSGTQVTVLNSDGKPERSTTGDRILGLLKDQLR
ncbi:MAG TPA: outer membrane protein assembly factor BamC [Burkholderiaceae bacterium]|nr:outer membrane protein assembly factor BamC [Burkholderiaceae bacterium]HQR69234.1 outer membrane protein assembly factor BamC [Burkholderiaceae bacterium]